MIAPIIGPAIRHAADALGSAALTESAVVRALHPLFSRVLQRKEIYLANHSLGRPLDQTADDVREAIDAWYAEMDGAWNLWLREQSTFRHNIASMIGLDRADAVVPKTSAGQGLRSVLNALDNPRVVATRGEFDSIDFILKTYAWKNKAKVRWVEPAPGRPPRFRAADILQAIEKESPDLVVVSLVFYATGQVLEDARSVIAAAHARGALVLLDVYHAAGVIPLDFLSLGADFAIGGSYKYTRGGAGACWLAIHPRHLSDNSLRTLDTGWFAKHDTFGFERPEEPLLAPGGDAWLESTFAPLPLFQARAGLQLVLAVGVDRLRAYSLSQLALLEGELQRHAVACVRGGPSAETSGGYLLLPDPNAPQRCDELKAAGVNTDARLGHIRLCPDILNTGEELSRAAAIIARVLRG
ncbi:MAG: aminotransferase class V-fold PLP-dependent enzyme [Planctomycetes bacterium]|nr:aminotransferase class V-fold PLP-dependent enzyme [Planctomycetota bacterium]